MSYFIPLFYPLNVSDPVRSALSIVLMILLFFSTFFGLWKLLRPRKRVLDLMLVRTGSWWVIFILYIAFICFDPLMAAVGLTLIGVAAVRELIAKLPAQQVPQNVKYIAYVCVPFQFLFAFQGNVLATVAFIPVGMFLIVSIYTVLFEKVETIFSAASMTIWGLLLTIYGLSHLTLLLSLPRISGFDAGASGLLLYFVFLVQFNDVLQFIWGTVFGKNRIAPSISPNKTWEGFVGGAITTTLIAVALRFLTPFSIAQSLILGSLIAVSGFLGDLKMSAIKRKLGIKDMGSLIPGHGGLLDRIDSITLSSLIYFYLIYYWVYVN